MRQMNMRIDPLYIKKLIPVRKENPARYFLCLQSGAAAKSDE